MIIPPPSVIDLETFQKWYNGLNNPLIGVPNSKIWITEDAIAIPIYRYNNYQVELYVLFDSTNINTHSHPNVKVIQNSYSPTHNTNDIMPLLDYPSTHGGLVCVEQSSKLLITYELWKPDIELTSLSVMWEGPTAGPIHTNLIRSVYPKSVIKDNIVYNIVL